MTVSSIRSFLDCTFFMVRGKIFQPINACLSLQQKRQNRALTEAAFRGLSVSYLHYRCFARPCSKHVNADALTRLRNLAKMRAAAYAYNK